MSILTIVDIVENRIPVLCLDTCSLLDVLRCPNRPKFQDTQHNAALQLLLHAEQQEKLAILLAAQARTELENLQISVETETQNEIKGLVAKVADIESVVSVYETHITADLHHLYKYVSLTRDVVDRYAKVATTISHSDSVVGRAHRRLTSAHAPAGKGRNAINDCLIIETYLDVVRQLRDEGHAKPIVFVSSNVNDYTEKGGSVPKSELAEEFSVLNMQYAPNMAAAKHKLGVLSKVGSEDDKI